MRTKEDWIADRARELAAEAFDNNLHGVQDWIAVAEIGNGTAEAERAAHDLMDEALAFARSPLTTRKELDDAYEALREVYCDEHADDYTDQAAEECAEYFDELQAESLEAMR